MSEQPPAGSWQQQGGDPRASAKAAKAYAKATRPWYKKKRFIIPLVLVVLIIIVSATSSGSGGSSGDDGPQKVAGDSSSKGDSGTDGGSKGPGTKGNPIKVGETVKLEGTQYRVSRAHTSPTVGDEFTKQRANGIYVVVDLTLENKKNETKTFSESAVKFLASNGKKYSTDDDGSIYSDKPLILEDMQPDVPKSGTLVFDVPKGKAKGGLLEVSDLFGRGKAYINLGLR